MDWSLLLALLGIPAGYMAGRWIRPYQHTSKEYNRTSFYALPALFEREVDEGLDNLTDDEITRMLDSLSYLRRSTQVPTPGGTA